MVNHNSETARSIKAHVTECVRKIARDVDWGHLTITQKQKYYEEWTRSPSIGGKLSEVMEASRVRVYLKDTVLKNYSISSRNSLEALLGSLNINVEVSKRFTKPTGILSSNNELYTVAPAKDWKTALMCAFERAFEAKNLKSNQVYLSDNVAGRYGDRGYRKMIELAASRLEVEVSWLI